MRKKKRDMQSDYNRRSSGGNQLFEIIKINSEQEEQWQLLIEQSTQTTPFIYDDYLAAVGFSANRFVVLRKKIPFMGICIPVDHKTGKSTGMVPYAPHQGLLYARSNSSFTDYHNNFEATEFLLNALFDQKVAKEISFSNSYMVDDMRAVQWHHYHQPELGMYNIRLRYTAIKQLKEPILADISKGRKLDYRYSKERYGLSCEISTDTKDFFELYEKTFSRQGIHLNDENIGIVRNLVELLLGNGSGELWYAVDSEGKRVDATVIVYDHRKAYYLFGANDPKYRDYGGGTLLLIEQMERMREKGLSYFDFIGVNSPQRGNFKLSFGGELKAYYICDVNYGNSRRQ